MQIKGNILHIVNNVTCYLIFVNSDFWAFRIPDSLLPAPEENEIRLVYNASELILILDPYLLRKV